MTSEYNNLAEEPFNPLAKDHLGESVARALLERPSNSLPPSEKFIGAGIYAIYYTGDFVPYKSITARGVEGQPNMPIYIGEAVSPGARKGGFDSGVGVSRALYNRLRQHAQSIDHAINLDVRDFSCRYLIVDDIWISLGESLLIDRFSPLWNVIVDGFGNHTPGKGRFNQERSAWDALHPGRPWADQCAPHHRSQEELISSIAQFFSSW